MSKRQKRIAFIGAFMGLLYLCREIFDMPEYLAGFCLGAAFAVLLMNLILTDERAERLCNWKKRVLARLVGRG